MEKVITFVLAVFCYTVGIVIIEYGEPNIEQWLDFVLDVSGVLLILLGGWIQNIGIEY